MERLRQWCTDINRVQAEVEYDFVYADEASFEQYKPKTFRQLMGGGLRKRGLLGTCHLYHQHTHHCQN